MDVIVQRVKDVIKDDLELRVLYPGRLLIHSNHHLNIRMIEKPWQKKAGYVPG
jgi:hypothetical protein